MAKSKALVKSNTNVFPILSNTEKISDKIVNKNNCKFCQSKYRKEAEDRYEQVKNIKVVHKFLEEKGESVAYSSVRNHIFNHYLVHERNIKIKEYGEQLEGWINEDRKRRGSIIERIAIMEKEMATIASNTIGQSLEDQRRNADILKKLSDTITALEDKIEEIDNALEPVEIIVNKLSDIISMEIKNSNSNEV